MSADTEPVRVLVRAAAILDLLSNERNGLGITELSRETGLSKSTVHHLLETLVTLRLADCNLSTRRYSLGVKAIQWGAAWLKSLDLAALGSAQLEQLRDLTGETATLHIRLGHTRICIAQAVSHHALRRVAQIGAPRELWFAATGLVLMSGMDDREIIEYLQSIRKTPPTTHTLTDDREILQRIRLIREKGYTISLEENELAVAALSMPVRDYSDRCVAAVSVTGPISRWNLDTIHERLPRALEICADLSQRLGWAAKDQVLSPSSA